MDDTALMARVAAIMRGAIDRARAAQPQSRTQKAHQDYVTDVDLRIDRYLDDALGALIPGCPVLSEERAVDHTGRLARYWIVDPIDGTLNMMAGLPFYGIAVALVDHAGPRLAAIGAIAQGDIYAARRGAGAWKNGAPLAVGAQPRAPLIVLSTGLLDHLVAEAPGAYAALRQIGKIRNLGAQALHLCAAAEGSLAAVASIEARVWDEAAGGLILREAGGLWRSQADSADWCDPAAMMAIAQQRSIAGHPDAVARIGAALGGVLGGPAA